MATVTVSTELAAPAARVFQAACTIDAFRIVTRGLLRFGGIAGRTGRWTEGETTEGWLWIGGVLPISRHRLTVAEIDDDRRVLRSDEGGGFIRSWRHDIAVEPIDDDRCRYTDVIEIDAGVLTPAVVAFANAFYRVRQRRWRELARVL